MNKKELRIQAKNIRDNISLENREKKSQLACDSLFSLSLLKNNLSNKNIFVYLNFGSETITKNIINEFRNRGANIFLPRVSSFKDGIMDIVEYNQGDELEKNKYGIDEPTSTRTISPKEVDIIILPALAFDGNMHRLGYGGGFYDRILSKTREDCLKIGLCFKEQVFDTIPYEKHDEIMDIIVGDDVVLYND